MRVVVGHDPTLHSQILLLYHSFGLGGILKYMLLTKEYQLFYTGRVYESLLESLFEIV